MEQANITAEFIFEQVRTEPVPSLLYGEHLKLTEKSHIAEFAGYLMPLWYSSIGDEHEAVRQTAGLFDCTHMGVIDVTGTDAQAFLEIITTNKVETLKPGSAQYSYILDAAGNVLDDIIVYRRNEDDFMVVVNAANRSKIAAYLTALKKGQAAADPENPKAKIKHSTRR